MQIITYYIIQIINVSLVKIEVLLATFKKRTHKTSERDSASGTAKCSSFRNKCYICMYIRMVRLRVLFSFITYEALFSLGIRVKAGLSQSIAGMPTR